MNFKFLAGAMPMLFSAQLMLSSQSALAIEVGETAPNVNLDQVQPDNSPLNGSILERLHAGQRFTMIEFFSITCNPCIESIPVLKTLNTDITSTTQMRSIALDRNEAAARAFVSERRSDLTYSVAFDSSRSATAAYGVRYTPTSFIIDSNNKVIYKHVGTFDPSDIDEIKTLGR